MSMCVNVAPALIWGYTHDRSRLHALLDFAHQLILQHAGISLQTTGEAPPATAVLDRPGGSIFFSAPRPSPGQVVSNVVMNRFKGVAFAIYCRSCEHGTARNASNWGPDASASPAASPSGATATPTATAASHAPTDTSASPEAQLRQSLALFQDMMAPTRNFPEFLLDDALLLLWMTAHQVMRTRKGPAPSAIELQKLALRRSHAILQEAAEQNATCARELQRVMNRVYWVDRVVKGRSGTPQPSQSGFGDFPVPMSWGPPASLTQQKANALETLCGSFLAKCVPVITDASVLLQEGRKLMSVIQEAFDVHAGLKATVVGRERGQPASPSFTQSMHHPHPLGVEDARLVENLTQRYGMFESAGLTPGKSEVLIQWHPNYHQMWLAQVGAFGSVEEAFRHCMMAADIGIRVVAYINPTSGCPAFQLQIGSGIANELLLRHYRRYVLSRGG
jgi:hypothetical protein